MWCAYTCVYYTLWEIWWVHFCRTLADWTLCQCWPESRRWATLSQVPGETCMNTQNFTRFVFYNQSQTIIPQSSIQPCNWKILYSGKLSREKTLRISQFESHPRKFSPRNLGMPYPPMLGFCIPQKFSPRNGRSQRSVKVFSLESFPLYGNIHRWLLFSPPN